MNHTYTFELNHTYTFESYLHSQLRSFCSFSGPPELLADRVELLLALAKLRSEEHHLLLKLRSRSGFGTKLQLQFPYTLLVGVPL